MGNCCTQVKQELSGPVDLTHFRPVRYIGRGAYGKVMVVMKRDTEQTYALKYVNKDMCIIQKAVKNVIRERDLLEELKSPFICNMRYAFQDDVNLYMCLDFMEGGDLRFHLNQKGWFTESVVRYMISEIALGLEYIHAHDVVHRDIKPANVLIDAAGHCYITDFNVAARTRLDRPITGTAGTYKYMAPEVLKRTPYTTEPDWWSLGVLMFECLYGRCPFRGKTREQITEQICSVGISYPTKRPQIVSSDGLAAIKALLCRETSNRLGCSSERQFREHPFFAVIDFVKLAARSTDYPPPFVPDVTQSNNDFHYGAKGWPTHERPPKRDLCQRQRRMRRSFWQLKTKAHPQGSKAEDPVSDRDKVNPGSRRRAKEESPAAADPPPEEKALVQGMIIMKMDFHDFDHTRRQEKSPQNVQQTIPGHFGTFPNEGPSYVERRGSASTATGDSAANVDGFIKEYDGNETGNTTVESCSN